MKRWHEVWGRKIRESRERADMSREAFAAALGVTVVTVYRWEAGTAGVKDEHKLAIAELFGYTDCRELFPLQPGIFRAAS